VVPGRSALVTSRLREPLMAACSIGGTVNRQAFDGGWQNRSVSNAGVAPREQFAYIPSPDTRTGKAGTDRRRPPLEHAPRPASSAASERLRQRSNDGEVADDVDAPRVAASPSTWASQMPILFGPKRRARPKVPPGPRIPIRDRPALPSPAACAMQLFSFSIETIVYRLNRNRGQAGPSGHRGQSSSIGSPDARFAPP
jgi:hypothetical protein